MSESKKNEKLNVKETQILEAFRMDQYEYEEQSKIVYVMLNRDWALEKVMTLSWVLKECQSFTEIDTYMDLFDMLEEKRVDKLTDVYRSLLYPTARQVFKLKPVRIITEVMNTIRHERLNIESIVRIVNAYNNLGPDNAEECIIKALRIMDKLARVNDHRRDDIECAVLICQSPRAICQIMELIQRGCPIELTESILTRYKYDSRAQSRALEKEIIRRRVIGSIRDEYSYL